MVVRDRPGYNRLKEELYVTSEELNEINQRELGLTPDEAEEISISSFAAHNRIESQKRLETAVVDLYNILQKVRDSDSLDMDLQDDVEQVLYEYEEYEPTPAEEA